MKKFSFVSIFLFITLSLQGQNPLKLDTLQIYFTTGDSIPKAVKAAFSTQMVDLIKYYNSWDRRKFVLLGATESNPDVLTIKLTGLKLVEKGEQAAATAVTLVGLALPIAMVASGAELFVGFAYFPKTKSLYELTFPERITNNFSKTKFREVKTGSFLKNIDQQIEKHGNKFRRFVMGVINGASQPK